MKTDKIKLFLVSLIVLATFSWISSCSHNADISGYPDVCFDTEVLPIFTNNCAIARCHNGNGEAMPLTKYTEIIQGVVAGNPDKSNIYQVMIDKWGINIMPPSQPISADNRTIVRIWIEQGAHEVICTPAAVDNGDNGDSVSKSYANPRTCFERDILPVLISKCSMAGCHDPITHKEGYNFTGYSEVMKAISPGSPSGSKLYQAITSVSEEKRMPPAPAIGISQVLTDSIAAWIKHGAPNEFCGEVCDTINPVTFSGKIWPVIQGYCLDCHSTSTATNKFVLLTNYSEISANAASGLLMNALKGNGVTKMPPAGSLSACRIQQFDKWVKNGYINN
jgi:hypothetical protein